jgi:hypothetical protein
MLDCQKQTTNANADVAASMSAAATAMDVTVVTAWVMWMTRSQNPND